MSTSALQFDLTARREKNLRVLKSIDENVVEVLADYSHVAVYQFDPSLRTWERLDVEGSLFITRSACDPLYSVIVLNKKGPSDFTLDILSIMKLSLQMPYIMMRCAAVDAPITFGIWSHNEAELDAIYALLVRIALNKECPVAPPSPQAMAGQLLSMLKPKKDAAGCSSLSPKSLAVSANTATVVSAAPADSASKKSAALLSMLKSAPASTPTESSENNYTSTAQASASVNTKASSSTSNKNDTASSGTSTSTAMSMQLMSILKSPASTKVSTNTANQSVTLSVTSSQVSHTSSAATSKASPVPVSMVKNGSSGTQEAPASKSKIISTPTPTPSSSQKALQEDQRAEMMLKLIKPRNTTVNDLLTDVDIAAKVKAASVVQAPASSAHSSNNAPAGKTAPVTADSKEDMLKNILMNKKKPEAPSTLAAPAPAAVVPQVSPTNRTGNTGNAIPVPLATPSAYRPATVSTGVTTPIVTAPTPSSAAPAASAESIAAAAAMFNQQGSSTQRSAELLAAALRNTAASIRSVQAGVQRSPLASPVTTSLYGPPIPSPSPVPATGPTGLPAPVAWASLSSHNSFSGIASAGVTGMNGSSKVASSAPPPAAAPARPVPVLISPSDLRNIAAASATR